MTTEADGPRRPDVAIPAPVGDGGLHDGAPLDRPLSRRELRRRSRRARAERTGPTPPADPSSPATGPRPGTPEPDAPVPGDVPDDGLLPPEHHRYTVTHYLTLAAVAAALGFLVWSLIAQAGEAGAAGAAPADPTTSLSAPPTAHRGEL